MKKETTLSSSEFMDAIKEAVRTASNETDGKMPNATINAVNDTQQCIGTKELESFLAPYIGFRFLFFTYKSTGNITHLVFDVENVKKMTDNTVILRGNVLFDSVSLTGDIHIEFNKDKDDNIQSKVYYKHKGNPYKYILLPDNRTVAKWNELLNGSVDSLIQKSTNK